MPSSLEIGNTHFPPICSLEGEHNQRVDRSVQAATAKRQGHVVGQFIRKSKDFEPGNLGKKLASALQGL